MTQTEWILVELGKRPLTAIDALEGCGCFRLAARINDLRNAGHKIRMETISKNGKSYARYHLEEEVAYA